MQRKRSAPAGSYKSPLIHRDDGSPAVKRAVPVQAINPSTPTSSQRSRFVSPSNFNKSFQSPLARLASPSIPSISTLPTTPKIQVFKSPQIFVNTPTSTSTPKPLIQIQSPGFSTLDFCTASQNPIKISSSKLTAAQSLLRDVQVDESAFKEERPQSTQGLENNIQSTVNEELKDSLDAELDVDWDQLNRTLEEQKNQTN